MYDLHEESQLPASQWVVVSSDVHTCFDSTGGRKFWEEVGRQNVHDSFAFYVDKLLANLEPSYAILPGDT